MNEQLQNTMNNAATVLIEKAMSGLDSATGFLQAEIPEYVYQLMLWYGVKNLILFFVGVVVLIVSFYGRKVMIVFRKRAIKAFEDGEPWAIYNNCRGITSTEYDMMTSNFLMVLPIAVGIPLSICLMSNVMEVIQIWIAPKVWLVEYASTLIK